MGEPREAARGAVPPWPLQGLSPAGELRPVPLLLRSPQPVRARPAVLSGRAGAVRSGSGPGGAGWGCAPQPPRGSPSAAPGVCPSAAPWRARSTRGPLSSHRGRRPQGPSRVRDTQPCELRFGGTWGGRGTQAAACADTGLREVPAGCTVQTEGIDRGRCLCHVRIPPKGLPTVPH